MRTFLFFFLLFFTLVLNSYSLPKCQGSDAEWNNCIGKKIYELKYDQGVAIYNGEWKNGKYNGQGTYTFPRGSKSAVCCEHVGKWKNGMPNGLGVHTYADGRIEEGMYKNGKFQYAQKVTPNKIVRKTSTKLGTCKGTYKPTWNNCIGTRTFNSGSKYSGQWRSGKEHGTGTLTYPDGEKYVGGFKNGMHHGNGIITSPNGKVMRGIWENDKFKSERK